MLVLQSIEKIDNHYFIYSLFFYSFQLLFFFSLKKNNYDVVYALCAMLQYITITTHHKLMELNFLIFNVNGRPLNVPCKLMAIHSYFPVCNWWYNHIFFPSFWNELHINTMSSWNLLKTSPSQWLRVYSIRSIPNGFCFDFYKVMFFYPFLSFLLFRLYAFFNTCDCLTDTQRNLFNEPCTTNTEKEKEMRGWRRRVKR